MCYFDGQRATILTVSKRKPLKGWKVLYPVGRGKWASPLFWAMRGGCGKRGQWRHASTHGYYVMTSKYLAEQAHSVRRWESVCRVLIAGKIRQYKTGYRAEWMKVL